LRQIRPDPSSVVVPAATGRAGLLAKAREMKVRDRELLARLRTLGSRARACAVVPAAPPETGEDVVGLLGLPEPELTPAVRATLAQLIGELAELRHELAGAQARVRELERLADEDSLAPIRNRRAFLRDLARTISHVERYGTPFGLLYFDVNGLKEINDRFGHGAGDAALIHVADLLCAHTRSSDVVGRLGGDEFAVLLALVDEAAALNKARQLAATIAAAEFRWEGVRIAMSVAYGAYCLAPREDAQVALAAADRAMYRQKRARARLEGIRR
jgi:diguanylate cyclase (GGDEF)-like protein